MSLSRRAEAGIQRKSISQALNSLRKQREGTGLWNWVAWGQLGSSVDWKPGLEIGGSRFKFGLRHILAMWPWASHLTPIAYCIVEKSLTPKDYIAQNSFLYYLQCFSCAVTFGYKLGGSASDVLFLMHSWLWRLWRGIDHGEEVMIVVFLYWLWAWHVVSVYNGYQ